MKVMKKCKICGKPITGCSTCYGKVLNWKNVACCIEHFQEYMKRVEEGRKQNDTR